MGFNAENATEAETSLIVGDSEETAGPLTPLRAAAAEGLAARGLPTRRVEAWKYTDLRAKLRNAYQPPDALAPAPEAPSAFADVNGHHIRLLNGAVRRTDAVQDGVQVLSLAEALDRVPELLSEHMGKVASIEPTIADVNGSWFDDAVVIRVSKNVKADRPLILSHLASGAGTFRHGRVLVVLETGAEAVLLESASGDDVDYLATCVCELILGPGSKLTHIAVQEEGASAAHLSAVAVHLDRDAR